LNERYFHINYYYLYLFIIIISFNKMIKVFRFQNNLSKQIVNQMNLLLVSKRLFFTHFDAEVSLLAHILRINQ
jgi:hypothetical protein